MYQDKPFRSFVFFGQSGCLLPLLIICNLLFGWIFLKPLYWLMVEAVLILLFIINSFMITRKIISTSLKHDDVIDIKGEMVEDEQKRKEILDER